jgi:hypothetical protein
MGTSVVSSADVDARLASVRAELGPSVNTLPRAVAGPLSRALRLHALWWDVAAPAISRSGGLRTRSAALVKRVIRRTTAWDTAGRWEAQREIDAEVARFATEVAEELTRLRAAVQDLQLSNVDLRRQLWRASRTDPHG